MNTTIRILLADDQALVRDALAAMLNLQPDFEVVAAVGRGDEVLPAVRSNQPDVALLDVEMPGGDGIATAAELRAKVPEVRVLIVTTFGRPGFLRRAFDAGAAGFVIKDSPADQLADAIRRVHRGLRVVDPHLAAESLAAGGNPLSVREADVLKLVLRGLPATEIAETLFLSNGTVRNYLSNAAAKVNARSGFEAAVVARDNGWL